MFENSFFPPLDNCAIFAVKAKQVRVRDLQRQHFSEERKINVKSLLYRKSVHFYHINVVPSLALDK